ncbi:MAG: hypothetical protein AAFN30_06915, partial [Actinomycetota bacterium]
MAGLALAAVVLAVFVLAFDRVAADRSLLLERPPTWGVAQQLRTMAIAAASILAVVPIRRLVGPAGVDRSTATPWQTLAAAIAGGIVAVGAAGLVL